MINFIQTSFYRSQVQREFDFNTFLHYLCLKHPWVNAGITPRDNQINHYQ